MYAVASTIRTYTSSDCMCMCTCGAIHSSSTETFQLTTVETVALLYIHTTIGCNASDRIAYISSTRNFKGVYENQVTLLSQSLKPLCLTMMK